MPIAFPVEGEEDVLGPVREALRVNGSRVSVAVFSHIASMPVLINPVKKLVELCHDNDGNNRSIPVVVDGAHAPGSHNQSSLPNMAASLTVIPVIIMPNRLSIETACMGLVPDEAVWPSAGQIHVNVSDIGSEVYIGDLHKWMFSPKGSAFIHVSANATTAEGHRLHDAIQ